MPFSVSVSLPWILSTAKPPLDLSSSSENGNVKVTLYPQWFRHITLEWAVPPAWGNCVFNVYFSQTEDGPFEKLNTMAIDSYYFTDTTTKEYSKVRKGYYIVEAILLDKGNAALRSEPTTWNTYQRKWVTIRANEIQRRENWLLTHFTGVKTYLFKKKSYGKRCPKCWSNRTESVTDDHCPVCLGTSWEGGFFPPVPIYLQYETTPKQVDYQYFGKLEPNQIGAWTISFPALMEEDVVIRVGDWAAYKVGPVTPTELQGNTVRQMIVLNRLAKGDVENRLVQRNLPDFPVVYTTSK
jgi:hypothetical protein